MLELPFDLGEKILNGTEGYNIRYTGRLLTGWSLKRGFGTYDVIPQNFRLVRVGN